MDHSPLKSSGKSYIPWCLWKLHDFPVPTPGPGTCSLSAHYSSPRCSWLLLWTCCLLFSLPGPIINNQTSLLKKITITISVISEGDAREPALSAFLFPRDWLLLLSFRPPYSLNPGPSDGLLLLSAYLSLHGIWSSQGLYKLVTTDGSSPSLCLPALLPCTAQHKLRFQVHLSMTRLGWEGAQLGCTHPLSLAKSAMKPCTPGSSYT